MFSPENATRKIEKDLCRQRKPPGVVEGTLEQLGWHFLAREKTVTKTLVAVRAL